VDFKVKCLKMKGEESFEGKTIFEFFWWNLKCRPERWFE
jgi:hypothetical protein